MACCAALKAEGCVRVGVLEKAWTEPERSPRGGQRLGGGAFTCNSARLQHCSHSPPAAVARRRSSGPDRRPATDLDPTSSGELNRTPCGARGEAARGAVDEPAAPRRGSRNVSGEPGATGDGAGATATAGAGRGGGGGRKAGTGLAPPSEEVSELVGGSRERGRCLAGVGGRRCSALLVFGGLPAGGLACAGLPPAVPAA